MLVLKVIKMSHNLLVLYLGQDTEFLKDLDLFCNETAVTKLEQHLLVKNVCYPKGYIDGTVTQESLKGNVVIAFVDFSDELSTHKALLDEIQFLKRQKSSRSILWVALWGSEDQKREFSYLFSNGFILSYIKGTENHLLFFDSFHLAFEKEIDSLDYARARNINLKLKVGFIASLSLISKNFFTIETDIEPSGDQFLLRMGIIDKLKEKSFKIKTHYFSNYQFPFTECYSMIYPYPGPWDEITIDSLQKETVETWIDNNQSKLKLLPKFIKVYTSNSLLLEDIADLNDTFVFESEDKMYQDTIDSELELKRPGLIFIELTKSDKNGAVDLEQAELLIKTIRKKPTYEPVLIFSQCPSQAVALGKLFQYKNLLAMEEALSLKSLKLFLETYKEKIKKEELTGEYCFSNIDSRRSIEIIDAIDLKSLTEHDVTFFYPTQIPMYSVLHFELPVDFYATIIPVYQEITKHQRGFYYKAIIHGISEDAKKDLRKFVNQIIYKPIESITKEVVESILEHAPEKIIPKVEEAVTKEADEEEPEVSQEVGGVKRRFKGKSKL